MRSPSTTVVLLLLSLPTAICDFLANRHTGSMLPELMTFHTTAQNLVVLLKSSKPLADMQATLMCPLQVYLEC